MKNTRTCPKCESAKLWVVEPLKTVHESAPGTLPLHLDYDQVEGTNLFNRSRIPVGMLDAWICAACGYTELWARELHRLKHAPERGVRLIEGERKG